MQKNDINQFQWNIWYLSGQINVDSEVQFFFMKIILSLNEGKYVSKHPGFRDTHQRITQVSFTHMWNWMWSCRKKRSGRKMWTCGISCEDFLDKNLNLCVKMLEKSLLKYDCDSSFCRSSVVNKLNNGYQDQPRHVMTRSAWRNIKHLLEFGCFGTFLPS